MQIIRSQRAIGRVLAFGHAIDFAGCCGMMDDQAPAPTKLVGVPERATIVRDDRGEMGLWEASPGTLRTVLRGYLSAGLAEQMIAAMERMIAGRAFDLFHDWSAYTGHDAAARSTMTQWSFRNRSQLRSLNILMPLPTKMISMAIAASNMILGGFMRVHHSRAAFDAEHARLGAR